MYTNLLRGRAVAFALALTTLAAYGAAENVAAIDDTSVAGLQGVVYFNGSLQYQQSFTTANVLNSISFAGNSNLNVYASTSAGVSLYDSNGNVLANYNNVGSDVFGSVAVDSAGDVFVADNTTGGIQGVVEFNSSLQVEHTFLFANPITGLSVGGGSSLYLTSAQSEYNTDLNGNINHEFDGFSADSFSFASFNGTTDYVADNTTEPGLQGVLEFSADLSSYGSFLTPNPITGLAADAGGTVFTSQGLNVFAYDGSGNQLAEYNGIGADEFGGLSVQPTATPAPAAAPLLLALFGGLLKRRSRRVSA